MRKANRTNQAGMPITKKYFTKLYREQLQYLKAAKGITRFNDSSNQSYKKPQLRDDEDSTAIMLAQMETRHQQQMESLRETMMQRTSG